MTYSLYTNVEDGYLRYRVSLYKVQEAIRELLTVLGSRDKQRPNMKENSALRRKGPHLDTPDKVLDAICPERLVVPPTGVELV